MDFPDMVEITVVTTDATYGSETKATPVNVRGYFEDASRLIPNDKGVIAQGITFAMLPAGTNVKKGDLLRRISKSGVTISGAVCEKVLRVSPIGGNMPSHLEVYTGNSGGLAS